MIFDWISFFFKEMIKNVFLYGILSTLFFFSFFFFNSGDMIHEKFKKKKNAQKTSLSSAVTWIAFLVRKTLKFGFLYFYKSCRELNFLSKNVNHESIGILSSKLWPKYETGAASFQNLNRDQHQIHPSSFKQVISSLSFRRKLIT